VLVKGGDYTRDQVVGHEIVEAGGGEILLVDILPGFSTTSLVNARARARREPGRGRLASPAVRRSGAIRPPGRRRRIFSRS
jgi:polyribonucleotide nucleotidyltransferase